MTSRTTRRQGPFLLDTTTPEAFEASVEALTDELARIEATCNRCLGRGYGWQGYAGGSCHRCAGTGSARARLEALLSEVPAERAHLASPGAIFSRWVHTNWMKGGNAAAHRHLCHLAMEIEHYGRRPSPTQWALICAVVEGRQTGPIRPETAERIRDENRYGREVYAA